MEVTARVASRVAHDFDNILTGVIGFAELTLPLLPAGAPKQYVTELLRVGQQGAELTRRLHQLGSAITVRNRRTALIAAWRKIDASLRAILPADVGLEVNLPDELPDVAIEPEPLRQALEPILMNASEAAPGSTIAVSARSVVLNEHDSESVYGNPRPGRYVVLTVADRGAGIAPEVRRRLFVEPCFSTKLRHRGLGLSYAFRVLHAHGGGFSLEPAEGGGTIARLYLPTSPP
jgi:signal transduction histidine kinase